MDDYIKSLVQGVAVEPLIKEVLKYSGKIYALTARESAKILRSTGDVSGASALEQFADAIEESGL